MAVGRTALPGRRVDAGVGELRMGGAGRWKARFRHGDRQARAPAGALAACIERSFGPRELHLAWTDRALNGTVQAERPEVGAQIRSTLHQLGAQLEALGMPSAQLSVREDSNAWLEAGS